MSKSTPKNPLSDRAKNIRKHPDLMDSIDDSDPIWNELFEYAINIHPLVIEFENEISIEDKAKVVRRLRPHPETDAWLSR
jgi:hypothetical protein